MRELTKKQEDDLLEQSLDETRDIKYEVMSSFDNGEDEDKEVYYKE